MGTHARRWICRARLGEAEAGLTMIEVLVAAVILVLGAAATFGLLGAATRNAQRAKASQVALDLAQEEMERLHSIPYNELAVSVLPPHESGEQKPNSRVRVSDKSFAVHRTPPSNYFPLVVELQKGVSPESDFFTGDTEGGGGVRGKIYRYVVWRNDPSCNTEECEKSEQDYKQIVVAVKPDTPVQQNTETGYVEVQSAVSPPPQNWKDQVPPPGEPSENDPEPGLAPGLTAQQFYLSDTACAASGATKRIEPTADHLLHNTLGTCASGLRTGTTPGAPDALLTSPPPDPYPTDETLPLLHDYSDDFYLEPTPDTDKGVQIRRDDTSGCHYEPTGTTNPESQVHRWVTDQMTKNFEMSGKAVLEFYTRTLNDALYTGTLCVYLFEREKVGTGQEAKVNDKLLTAKSEGTLYWTYTPEGNGYWPRNSWTKVRLTMEFEKAPWTILKEHRLGLALSVDRANTPADAIPILYDHPNYASRLEVDTKTPIEGG